MVWLLNLGVGVAHGRPYHPYTQGKEERSHRTLKAEVLDQRLETLDQAQDAFDRWREVYNAVRPHEALQLDTPASRYHVSPRRWPKLVSPPDYEPQAIVRKVHDGGWISFRGRPIKCPKAFVGRRLALRATHLDGVFDLCYRSHLLAQLDLRQNIIETVLDVSERMSSMSPV